MSRSVVAITDADGVRAQALGDCEIRCLAKAGETVDPAVGAYLIDGADLGPAGLAAAAGIILPREGEARARELLAAGARRVLLGEAALLDSALVATLAATFGRERVGVYVPARRFRVSWSFDASSNADFKVMAPSLGAPAWEALRADGETTGTHALWWIGEMLMIGASEALLRVDVRDDADLNLCAECVERFAERVWIGPLTDEAPMLGDWVRYGHARRLALPPALFARAAAVDASIPASTNASSVTTLGAA